MRFPRLSDLSNVPRPLTPELEQISGKPFFFLPWAVSSWKRRMQNAPLVEAAIVQASADLYTPEASWAPAVVCFMLGSGALDGRSALSLAAHLVAIRDGAAPDVSGGRITSNLRDESSSFYEALPIQLGPACFYATVYVDPRRLPNGCLPRNAVLPALVNPTEEFFELIPPTLWM